MFFSPEPPRTLSPKKSYLTLEVSASDLDDGVDVVIPTVKFQFR